MAKTEVQSVDEYIAAQPEDAQKALKRVRSIIRKAVPRAGEVISYKIPTYKLHGSAVIFFAGWKKHFSLYPATDKLVAALKKDLAPYEVSKGTIRFPLSEKVPVALIEQIAKFRAAEVAGGRPEKLAVNKPANPVVEKPVVKAVAKKTAAKKSVAKKIVAKKSSKPAAKKPAKPKAKSESKKR